MASIKLSNVSKCFDNTQIIHNVNLDIKEGDFTVFVGPSGCGKSTLLRMIAGLEETSSGEIIIGGSVVNDTPPSERGVAMVFQSYALYPHMTVAENMAYSLKVNKVPKVERDKKVQSVSNALQLDHLLDRKPAQLSGGQRQRVAIGRAIVRDPSVFLFDEPLSNLDAELRVDMRLHIAKLHKELQSTMIYVTHDQVEAMTLADKIVVLRNGSIEQVGTPLELYHNPKNQFVAGFIGSPKMNFIHSKLISWQPSNITLELTGLKQLITLSIATEKREPGEILTLGIRPEHLSLDPQDITFDFQCEVIERLGGMAYLFGKCAGVNDFKFLQHGISNIHAGQSVILHALLNNIHVFDTAGHTITAK